MRWIVGWSLVVVVAGCAAEDDDKSGGGGATEAGDSNGCTDDPEPPVCRLGPANACGAVVATECVAGFSVCPDGAVEASRCADAAACDDMPAPACWPDNASVCTEASQVDPSCQEGRWQCPPGASQDCGHGHSICDFEPTVACVEGPAEDCSDTPVEPECDNDWFCPRGSTNTEQCVESGSTGGADSTSSSTGHGSTGDTSGSSGGG